MADDAGAPRIGGAEQRTPPGRELGEREFAAKKRIEDLRMRLLDLTNSNRLLNCRFPGSNELGWISRLVSARAVGAPLAAAAVQSDGFTQPTSSKTSRCEKIVPVTRMEGAPRRRLTRSTQFN